MSHLWTPWRSTYMKGKSENSGCIFCEAAAREDDSTTLVLLRAQFCFLILNRYPYTSGHLMIAPYQHSSQLTGISEEAALEMMRMARLSEEAIENSYHPDGLNIGMNLGEAAGAGIAQHIHLHVLPRWKGDANFMSTVGDTRIIPEALEESYRKLHAELTRLSVQS